jgi:crotonobetainyl-CoA:carnitine CoA-transferase CaiB-like acyl-CoA transferase
MPASTPPPLEGCRALDLSQVIAGPPAVTTLADHGGD